MAASTSGKAPIVLDEDDDGPDEEGRSFEQDAAVRLIRLQGSAHLNGRLAVVLRFMPEKLRYEVALHPGNDKKALKPNNMEPVPLLDEVTLLRDRLANPKVDVSIARPALRRLEALRITTDVLRQTLVGKVVNEVAQNFMTMKTATPVRGSAQLDEIGESAKRLVTRWREMYRQEQANEKGKNTGGVAVSSASVAPPAPPSAKAGVTRSGTTASGRPGWSLVPPQREAKRARIAAPPMASALEAPPMAPPLDRPRQAEAPPTAPLAAPAADRRAADSPAATAASSAPAPGPLAAAPASAVPPEAAAAEVDSSSEQAHAAGQNASPPLDYQEEEEAADALPPESCPAELHGLEPAYANMLMNNPKIKDFLLKHPHMMKNLNADNVKFLIRNVMRSCNAKRKQGERASHPESGSAAGRALTISNLPAEATESDVGLLFARAGLGQVEVSLARESRYRRSCGIAFVIVDSCEAREEALIELQDAIVHGHRIRVECAGARAGDDSPTGGDGEGRRIVWKDDDELWEVALYDRVESVLDFRERVQDGINAAPLAMPPDVDPSVFKEAASRERVEESRRVREALGSDPA